jgi:hypothetical protein
MATSFQRVGDEIAATPATGLSDPKLSIINPRADALLLWGSPVIALVFAWAWMRIAGMLPSAEGDHMVGALVALVAILTYAHLVAVVPRAYLNREVFNTHRGRLTIGPLVLISTMLISTPVFVACLIAAIMWDVHHSAMQTFGLGRIYDMKAGNDGNVLRRTDMLLNGAMYIGPLAAGAALVAQFHPFQPIGDYGWRALTQVPGVVAGWAGTIRIIAITASLAIVALATVNYARAMRDGSYKLPQHKAVLIATTGTVSLCMWLFTPPFLAYVISNIFHAMQYFAIVWLKEGRRIAGFGRGGEREASTLAFVTFFAICFAFGIVYWAESGPYRLILAPFIACSLLHFWFDGFVWSVRRKQV